MPWDGICGLERPLLVVVGTFETIVLPKHIYVKAVDTRRKARLTTWVFSTGPRS
jgi:hypothetical protein